MTTDVYDMDIDQGATYVTTVTWDVDDVLVDLTNYTARLQARHTVDSTTTFISLTDTSGLTLGGANGTIIITLTAAETAALTEKFGVYDLEMIDVSGVVTRLLQGDVTISREVSR